MESYRAIRYFTDTKDNNHPYSAGDIYPRAGYEVSKQRLNELLGFGNKQHRPVIEVFTEEIPFGPQKYTAKELESMTIAKIEDLAEELGYEITRTLKADIIDEFLSQQ
jgi:hypothetical protein